jgi:hypothetical protein
MSAVSFTMFLHGGTVIQSPFLDAKERLRGNPPATSHSASSENCHHGSPEADTVNLSADHDCYNLLAGDDSFNGEGALRNLVVDAGSGQGGYTRLTTGSGSDQIKSGQSGAIATGDGDDVINLQRHGSTRFHIDPGAGSDRLRVVVGARPRGAPPNKILSGVGDLDADITCSNDTVHLALLPDSRVSLGGSCAMDVSTEGGAGSRVLVAAVDQLSANFIHSDLLNLDIRTGRNSISPGPQGLYVSDWGAGQISYSAISHSYVDLHITSKSTPASAYVYADLEAPDGTTIFDGVGSAEWDIRVHYHSRGQVALTFPNEPHFSDMQAPKLSGVAQGLRISGCFERIAIVEAGQTTKFPGCSVDADFTHHMSDPAATSSIELHRENGKQVIPLGSSGLEVQKLIISR